VLRTSVFQPGAVPHAVEQLKKFEAIVPASNGSMAQQQRVPFFDIKEYFYVIDPKKLRTPNRDNHRQRLYLVSCGLSVELHPDAAFIFVGIAKTRVGSFLVRRLDGNRGRTSL
jgi:hypothetical protein